jgi:hypothetical protein
MLLSAPTICRRNVWLPLAVERAVGQHTANGSQVAGALEQGTQPGPVVGRAAVGRLRQDELARPIHDHPPCAPVAPRTPVATGADPMDEAGADGSRRQAGRIDGDRRPVVPPSGGGGIRHSVARSKRATSSSCRRRRHRYTVVESATRSILAHVSQLGVLPQAHLCLARGPVLRAQETADRQQARLGERVLRERAALRLRYGGTAASATSRAIWAHRTGPISAICTPPHTLAAGSAPGWQQGQMTCSLAVLMEATCLLRRYCWLIKSGKKVPHRRHWAALLSVVRGQRDSQLTTP